jgi:hypothetical protein
MTKTIYIDMDGVVADFETLARAQLSDLALTADDQGRFPDTAWQEIVSNPRFYRDLPEMPRARDLMDLAMRFRDSLGYELRMLTAIPRHNDVAWCFWDKFCWMQARWPEIPVFFGPYSQDKQLHCGGPGDILVDDRLSNCEEWQAQGGRAIRVTREYEQALRELREILDQELRELRDTDS